MGCRHYDGAVLSGAHRDRHAQQVARWIGDLPARIMEEHALHTPSITFDTNGVRQLRTVTRAADQFRPTLEQLDQSRNDIQ